MSRLRVGTRGSPLALRQTELVLQRLKELRPQVETEIVPIRTSGDRLAQAALAEFGGKGLFVKEIEEALLHGRLDLAVHSLKDLPSELPEELCLAAFPPRDDPRDLLVSQQGGGLADLPASAVVATSSLRRRAQLLARRPDLRIEPIRGNVETRLRKLSEQLYDAIVVAAAGLARLGLSPDTAWPLPPDEFVPAVGQGILAVEARVEDRPVLDLLRGLDHAPTRWQAESERAFLHHLGASCYTPVAAHALIRDGELRLVGMVAGLDGQEIIRGEVVGACEGAALLGQKLAEDLKARGAQALLDVARAR
ncbi:MAG: hydroxymethylbilane synthase [candidate division NC10 bacterium]